MSLAVFLDEDEQLEHKFLLFFALYCWSLSLVRSNFSELAFKA